MKKKRDQKKKRVEKRRRIEKGKDLKSDLEGSVHILEVAVVVERGADEEDMMMKMIRKEGDMMRIAILTTTITETLQ